MQINKLISDRPAPYLNPPEEVNLINNVFQTDEIFLLIFKNLDCKSRAVTRQVCKRWSYSTTVEENEKIRLIYQMAYLPIDFIVENLSSNKTAIIAQLNNLHKNNIISNFSVSDLSKISDKEIQSSLEQIQNSIIQVLSCDSTLSDLADMEVKSRFKKSLNSTLSDLANMEVKYRAKKSLNPNLHQSLQKIVKFAIANIELQKMQVSQDYSNLDILITKMAKFSVQKAMDMATLYPSESSEETIDNAISEYLEIYLKNNTINKLDNILKQLILSAPIDQISNLLIKNIVAWARVRPEKAIILLERLSAMEFTLPHPYLGCIYFLISSELNCRNHIRESLEYETKAHDLLASEEAITNAAINEDSLSEKEQMLIETFGIAALLNINLGNFSNALIYLKKMPRWMLPDGIPLLLSHITNENIEEIQKLLKSLAIEMDLRREILEIINDHNDNPSNHFKISISF